MAQNGSSSPYSFYGLGEQKFKGVFENRSMGGLSIFADSVHMNIKNPASNATLRLTTFSIGATNNWNTIKSNLGSVEVQRTNLDYVAIGLPLGKFGANFGIMPLTSVGYKNRNTFTDGDLERTQIFEGKGGVNRFFTSFGYDINKNFAIGVTLNYDFGIIETKNSEFITNVETGSRELDNSNIRGFVANFGLMYKKVIKNNKVAYGSFTFSPESRHSSTNTRRLSTISFSSIFGETIIDNQLINVPNKDVILPSKISMGAGIGQSNKWLVGAEFTTQLSGNLDNRFNDFQNTTFDPAYQISVGGFYVPKFNSFTSYFSRVTYRAGIRYEDTGLRIQNQSITDFGTNFGLGLPVGGAFSKINIGFEIGSKGTLSQNLVKEKYFNLFVGFTINDKWFQKIKYD